MKKKIFLILFANVAFLLIGTILLLANRSMRVRSIASNIRVLDISSPLQQENLDGFEKNKVEVDCVLKNISKLTVEKISDDYEIYGNTALTDSAFRKIVKQGNKSIYLLYRTNKKINLPYEASLYVKSGNKTYSYEYCEKESYNEDIILSGIKSFVLKYMVINNNKDLFFNEKKTMRLTAFVPETFVNCVVEKEYMVNFENAGYLTYHIAVSKYVANEKSIIYIVTVNNSFVPGSVAYLNGEKQYKRWHNSEGYVHMLVEQAYDANEESIYGRRWGNQPYKKDYWPLNEPSVIAIGSSVQGGVNLGYSFTNGFSLDNINVSQDKSIGANIIFGYSKTITQTDPKISAQVNSSNLNKCEWNFKYHDPVDETYHLNTSYMFEIENSRNGMLIGDFRLKLDFWSKLYTGWAWFYHDYYDSVDLLVRAGEEQEIYDFCYGMI